MQEVWQNAKTHYLVIPNETTEPDSIHQWLLKPTGERLIGSLGHHHEPLINLKITQSGTTRHQVPSKVMQKEAYSIASAVFLGEKF